MNWIKLHTASPPNKEQIRILNADHFVELVPQASNTLNMTAIKTVDGQTIYVKETFGEITKMVEEQ